MTKPVDGKVNNREKLLENYATNHPTAHRTHRAPLYHLVPLELIEAVAAARAEGDLKYAPSNWKQGGRAFYVDCINHTIAHLYNTVDLEDLDGAEEHLGHAAANIGFMLWALKRGLLRRKDFMNAVTVFRQEDNPKDPSTEVGPSD